MKTLVFAGICLFGLTSQAGDAVAVGYTADGTWTAIMYYCSSTPKGGADYKNAADAREAALRDLRRRVGENMVRSTIIADSDRTGHVAVARGKTKAGKDEIVVGRGKSQAEADKKALADLEQRGATAGQKIAYRYFSHGDDSAAGR
jgi:hypothetical protein